VKTLLVTILITLVATLAATAAAAGPEELQTTPVGRLPFPERGFVIDLPDGVTASRGAFRVTENGRRVENVDVAALGTAGISYGTVLAIDTSLSMKGAPLIAALAAGRSFVAHRAAGQQIGVVAFDGRIRVLRRPGPDDGQLTRLFSGARSGIRDAHLRRWSDRWRFSTARDCRVARSCCSRTAPTSGAGASSTA
jgi:hypothetical protein